MRPVRKKLLGPGGRTLLDRRPGERLSDAGERAQLAMNQLAVRFMVSGSGQFQSVYDRLLQGMMQKSLDMLDEIKRDFKPVIREALGADSDFRKDMSELRVLGSEMRKAVGELWSEVKDSFTPYDPDKRRITRESCEKEALQAFTDAAGAAHETISRGGYDVGPVSRELMAVTYAHDVMDAAEGCVGAESRMSDSMAVSYVTRRSASDGYVLSGVRPGDSYSDVWQAFHSEIERTGERTFADCLADAARAARETPRSEPSQTARPACGHDLRGLELRESSDGPDRSCTF